MGDRRLGVFRELWSAGAATRSAPAAATLSWSFISRSVMTWAAVSGSDAPLSALPDEGVFPVRSHPGAVDVGAHPRTALAASATGPTVSSTVRAAL